LAGKKETLKELTKKAEELRLDVEALDLMKDALGPNGIKAIMVDYLVPQLETKINNILEKLSEFTVKLDTQKRGIGEETVLEGLFINIINEQGEEFSFNNYSGGQRLKIIVSISEALAEVQKIGFRVLDELFIGLDEDSIEEFTAVMLELQERFSQMICISHLTSIKNIFDERLLAVNTNGVSSITKC